ncbi:MULTISPECIES: alpha/beta hydrolase [Vibrio]|jgi:predicted esterase|uniref:alpha/beta hydrolase n=1 Tax=Vibrio TaxID=662 RepID=UPI00352C4B90
MSKFKAGLPIAILSSAVIVFSSQASSDLGFKMTPKVTYGFGNVTTDEIVHSRELWMNVFEPTDKSHIKETAIVMTFGGAFHQGSPDLSFNVGGAQDTSMNDYCQRFAKQGYVCFAIDYRLAPENPLPTGIGYTAEDLDLESISSMSQQINLVRHQLGYDQLDFNNPSEKSIIDKAILSAAEDLRNAVGYIKENSNEYGFNSSKVVLGGFSAGAVTSLNVAHGMKLPVAGTFMLSGGPAGFDIIKNTTNFEASSPVLLFQGQNDLHAAFSINPPLLEHYKQEQIENTFAWVPGFGHFYPAEAVSLSGDGMRMSVEQRIMNFVSNIDQRSN